MATIKALIGADGAERLYALKDALKADRILDEDPMRLNRTMFEKYLSAKAEAIIVEQTCQGTEIDKAFRNAGLYIKVLDTKWRQAAKELNEALNAQAS